MDIKLFSDLIDALGKVAGGLKDLANFPKSERERYRQLLDDTYQLIHISLNMIIFRLGDVLRCKKDDEFLQEVFSLENYTEWMETERKLRLCQSLRIAVREMENLSHRSIGKISVKDWEGLMGQMRNILMAEGELANYIGEHFATIAFQARDTLQGLPASPPASNLR